MASKPKAKAALPPAEEPEAVVEETVAEVSYKLSLPESLSMLREIDVAGLSDDDRRAAILEIKALLEALQEAEKPQDDHLEQRLWLLQTWDNVIRLQIEDIKHERALPDYSIKVTRLFDEAKLALAAAEEAARIEAEKAAEEAARLEAEAKAKAEADEAAALHAAEHGEEAPETVAASATHEDEPHADEVHADPAAEAEAELPADLVTEAHEEPAETAESMAVDEEAVAHDNDDEIVAEGDYQGSEPNLSLEAGEDGFVKLRLLEHTEIGNIRLPAHINIEIPLEHAEELVGKESARPLRADEEFEPRE